MSEYDMAPKAGVDQAAAKPDREALLKAYDSKEVEAIMEMDRHFQHGDDAQVLATDAITAAAVKTNGS